MDNIGITDRAAITVPERPMAPTAVAAATAETKGVGNLGLPLEQSSSVHDQLSRSPTNQSPRDGKLAPIDDEAGAPDEAGIREDLGREYQVSRMAEDRKETITDDTLGTTVPSGANVDTRAAGQGMHEGHRVSSAEDLAGSDNLTEELPGTTTGKGDNVKATPAGDGAGGKDEQGQDLANLAGADSNM